MSASNCSCVPRNIVAAEKKKKKNLLTIHQKNPRQKKNIEFVFERCCYRGQNQVFIAKGMVGILYNISCQGRRQGRPDPPNQGRAQEFEKGAQF